LKTKGPLSASRCLCGEGPHSFTASNRCLRHPRRFRFISDRLTVCLKNGDNLTWHFSAIGVGTVCRKNGTFGPLRNSVKLLGSRLAHTCRILACMQSQRNTRSLYDLQRPHTFHSAERMRHPWRRRGLKTKGPLSASRRLCGDGPHSFTASNQCLRHLRLSQKWGQVQMALKCHLSRHSMPKDRHIRAIAQFCHAAKIVLR